MSVTRNGAVWSSMQRLLQGTALVLGLSAALNSPAFADQLLPADFFATQSVSNSSQMFVSADFLTVDHKTSIVTARGNVRMSTEGYLVAAESAEYNQNTGEVNLIGSVAVRDPQGEQYIAERAQLFGGFRQGFLKSLVFETKEGLRLSAADAELRENKSLFLDDASLTPCGNCIDAKGRQIGWRIKAAKVIRDTEDKTIYFTSGSLEIAGIPIAYLPWLALPDPSQRDIEDLLRTGISYSPEKGVAIKYPGFTWTNSDLGLTLSPEFYTRQGVLGELNWRKGFGDGTFALDAWGIYQLDPSAYAGKLGDTNFRAALQGKADYSFDDGWKAGGQFTTFTDRSFLPDYNKGRREGSFATQRVFAQQLTEDGYVDARAEYYTGLGESGATDESQQGHNLPQITGHKTIEAPNGFGQIVLDGKLTRITRAADRTASTGGVEYVDGFAGEKTHLMAQTAWRDRWTLPAGLLIEPYLGLRGDFAQYDGASGHAEAPAASVTHSVTPIAALDVSWPVVANADNGAHYIIPRLQIVSRGGPTNTGITNDDAHSFVFDDTNLFAFNRFSGVDRQDSGTRAALGVTYHADLSSGQWFEFTIGQSYHLGGANGAAVANTAQTGIGSGADAQVSHIVIGAKGQPMDGIELGGKLLVDPTDASIDRAAIAAKYAGELFSLGADYSYQSQTMAPGVSADRHEIGGNVSIPIDDYWKFGADARYDLQSNSLNNYGVEFGYDDGYAAGSIYYRSQGAAGFEGDRIGAKLKLKMLADVGYDHNL